MRLPCLSVASFPVCFHDMEEQRRSQMRPLTSFPFVSNVSCQKSLSQNIPRLNPLDPAFVPKRTVSLETATVHQHNHQRALIMQRREHCRHHQVWRIPFYGTAIEREEYRKEIRDHLKRQMEEKHAVLKLQLAGEVQEAECLLEAERLASCAERDRRIQHAKAMTAYRDENKKLMEQRWRDRALTRSQEALKERELLRLNPINWSGTLK